LKALRFGNFKRNKSIKLPTGEDVPRPLTTEQLNIPKNILNLSSATQRTLFKVLAGYLEISQAFHHKATA